MTLVERCRLCACIFVAVALTQCEPAPHNPDTKAAPHVGPKVMPPTHNVIRIKKRARDTSVPSETHPKPWGQDFNPTGRLVSELKIMFGQPASETSESISFHWSGLGFNFKTKNGKVLEMERHLGEVPLRIDTLIQKRSLETAGGLIPHMEAWLSYWDPVGCTPGELKAALGNPTKENSEALVYRFLTPFSGIQYIFSLKNGEVVKIERVG